MPFSKIKHWLEKEKSLGSHYPDRIVLATSDKNAIPHSRIVAIKEITEQSILFFTQRGSRKALEMQNNPVASATLWLPLQQREVMMDGTISALPDHENELYWKNLPRETQLRFSTYASMSTQPIASANDLNEKLALLSITYQDIDVPIKNAYCGYRIIPKTFYFYTLGIETFSEYNKVEWMNEKWQWQLLSP